MHAPNSYIAVYFAVTNKTVHVCRGFLDGVLFHVEQTQSVEHLMKDVGNGNIQSIFHVAHDHDARSASESKAPGEDVSVACCNRHYEERHSVFCFQAASVHPDNTPSEQTRVRADPGHRNTGRSAVIRHHVRGRFPVCLSQLIEKQHNFPRQSSSLERDARFENGSLCCPRLYVDTKLDWTEF